MYGIDSHPYLSIFLLPNETYYGKMVIIHILTVELKLTSKFDYQITTLNFLTPTLVLNLSSYGNTGDIVIV